MDAAAPSSIGQNPALGGRSRAVVAKTPFVRLVAKEGKGDEVEAVMQTALADVQEQPDTTTWYAVRFDHCIFAIFVPDDGAHVAHLAGKVGRRLIARTPTLFDGVPTIEHAQVLAYELPGDGPQVGD